MGSLNLPPELKLSIAENLDPISSFNFAITCKEHWKLCDPINRRHARLFAENRTIDTADAGRLLWDKLKEILDDHRVGWYLRDLSLPSNRQTYWDESVGHDFQLTGQTLKPPEEDLIRYYRAVEDVEERYGTEMLTKLYWKGKWEAGLGNGAEEPIINILVHHLPHLKVFRVTDAEISTSFYGLMRFIAEGYCEPALAPNLPFQHLNTVAIAHHDSEMSVDAEWCHFFCSIPTVQNFVAHAMGGEMLFDFRERIPRSNVRELVFQYCRFDAGALESILMNTPKLERFSYDIAGATVSEEVYSTWPKKVLQSLVENVSDSLEHLVFEADDAGDDFDNESDDESYNPVYRVSLRDFHKLKTLRCDWRMLWPSDLVKDSDKDEVLPDECFYTEDSEPMDDFDLRTILPASLEALHLEGPCDDREWERLGKFCDEASDLLPNLSRIYIADRRRNKAIGTPDGERLPGTSENPLTEFLQGQGYI